MDKVGEKETQENELVKRIKNIEKKLAEIERESKVGLEDQLFFGLVVSLALFVMTLPLTDLASFFQNVIGIKNTTAWSLSETIRNATIVSLLLSILLRYYGAVKPHKGARLLSFLCLIVSLDSFLFAFLPTLTLNLAVEVRTLAFPLSHIALFFIYFLLGRFVESRLISFYAKRGFVLKRYAKPIVSFLFACLSACLYTALIVQLLAIVYFNTVFNEVQMGFVYALAYFFLVVIGYLLFLRRQKIIQF